tara:strand:- start:58 stop:549 length:492 start_codon:yes stop_codon:yes gene_type:complete
MRQFKTTSELVSNYKAGTFLTIETFAKVKSLKAFSHLNIEKKVTYTNARMGMNYDNISETKDLRNSGEIPSENEGLKWGTWLNFPYTICHTDKKGEYNEYLRFYANTNKLKVVYFVNGIETSKEEVLPMLPKKSKSDREVLTLSPKISSVTNILEQKEELELV